MIGKEMQNKINQLYEKDSKSLRDISKLLHCSRNTVLGNINKVAWGSNFPTGAIISLFSKPNLQILD